MPMDTASLYKSLDHGEIRLLELQPGNGEDTIRATLHQHRLDAAPRYETISYVWGDPTVRESIICDGVLVETTQNLYQALKQFREPTTSRLLWADAICINQNDLDERATQVMIMHEIYKSCQRCLVWLGPADEHSPVALRVIGEIAAILCKERGIALDEIDKDLDENGRDPVLTSRLHFDGLPPPDSLDWVSLYHFFDRPWFSRIWVIQELYFAPNSFIFRGDYSTTFAPLYHATFWILTNSSKLDISMVLTMGTLFSSWSSNLLIMRGDKLTGQREQTIDQLLYDGKAFNATDPRDKIYALMNFPTFRREEMDITPDYSKSIREVYTEVTLAVIRQTKNLRILTCLWDNLTDTEDEFPSWVPRWHVNKKGNVARVWYDNYAASGSSTPSVSVLSSTVICVRGLEFDTIEEVAEISCLGTKPVVFTKLTPWDAYSISDEMPYPTKADVITTYAMTLTGGHSEHEGVFGIPVTNEMVHDHCAKFIAWLEVLRKLDAQFKNSNGYADSNESCYPPGMYSETLPCLPEIEETLRNSYAEKFQPMVNLYTSGPRRLFRTKKGYLGLGFQEPQVGDNICVLQGGNVPFILRKIGESSRFQVIGDCYVHGIMKGEVMGMAEKGGTELQDFELN